MMRLILLTLSLKIEMRIKVLFNLVRSLRSEASWRNAAMERRPRAAISQIFQWTLILIQLRENDEREQLSTLSEEVPAVHKAHTLRLSPWEVPGKTATNAITTSTTTEPEFQEAYFSFQDFIVMTHSWRFSTLTGQCSACLWPHC